MKTKIMLFLPLVFVLFTIVFIVSFYSCDTIKDSSDRSTRLKLSDGGLISSNTANETTPKFVSSPDGNTYLYYASDKDGSFDIYRAKYDITTDSFFTPEKLSSLINDPVANEQYFDIVPDFNSNSMGIYYTKKTGSNSYIYYSSIDNPSPQNVKLSGVNEQGIVSSIVMNNMSGPPMLVYFTSGTTSRSAVLTANTSTMQVNYTDLILTTESYFPIAGVGQYVNPWSIQNGYGQDGFILSKKTDSEGYEICIFPIKVNDSYGMPASSSMNIEDADLDILTKFNTDYDDITPFVDMNGTVYCACNKDGTYDLYRFNLNKLVVEDSFSKDFIAMGTSTTELGGSSTTFMGGTSTTNPLGITVIYAGNMFENLNVGAYSYTANGSAIGDPSGDTLSYSWSISPVDPAVQLVSNVGKYAGIQVSSTSFGDKFAVVKNYTLQVVASSGAFANTFVNNIKFARPDVIFVSGATGTPTGSGDYYAPMNTIANGISLLAPSRNFIAVAQNTSGYNEGALSLPNPAISEINVIGGYSTDFTVKFPNIKTVINWSGSNPTFIINSISPACLIEGFYINNNQSGAGDIPAIEITNSKAIIVNNIIYASRTGTSNPISAIKAINCNSTMRPEIYNNIINVKNNVASAPAYGIAISNFTSAADSVICNNTIEVFANGSPTKRNGIYYESASNNISLKLLNNIIFSTDTATPTDNIGVFINNGGSIVTSNIMNNLIFKQGSVWNTACINSNTYANVTALNSSSVGGITCTSNISASSVGPVFGGNYIDGSQPVQYRIPGGSIAINAGLGSTGLTGFGASPPQSDIEGSPRNIAGYTIGAYGGS